MNFKRLAWLIVPVVAVPLVVGSGVAAWWFAGQNNSTTTEQPLSESVADEAILKNIKSLFIWHGSESFDEAFADLTPSSTGTNAIEATMTVTDFYVSFPSPIKTRAVIPDEVALNANNYELNLNFTLTTPNNKFNTYFDAYIQTADGAPMQQNTGALTSQATDIKGTPGNYYIEFTPLDIYVGYKPGMSPTSYRELSEIVQLINTTPTREYIRLNFSSGIQLK